jgi:hypothetical protein
MAGVWIWSLEFDPRSRNLAAFMLPISVLVPTRNSMSLLPAHLEKMREWRGSVQEIIAVDSHSTDGTLETLRNEFNSHNTRVLTHPPGLYQSWNFGIAECRARFIYISTVGETITREGLEKLAQVAAQFEADAVISPPRMLEVSGKPKHKIWPIHELLEVLPDKGPVMLPPPETQLFAVAHLLRGILGSSASNLYRSEVLQRWPFRTDFGTAGDLAWGLEHSGHVRLAVVPETFSTFVFHPKSYAKSDYAVSDFNQKCHAVAKAAVEATAHLQHRRRVNELVQAWAALFAAKRAVLEAKQKPLWWAKPSALRRHRARSAADARLHHLQHDAMLELARSVAHHAPLS